MKAPTGGNKEYFGRLLGDKVEQVERYKEASHLWYQRLVIYVET
jgi:hypothetical protein